MIDLLEHFKKDEALELMHLTHKALKDGGFFYQNPECIKSSLRPVL